MHLYSALFFAENLLTNFGNITIFYKSTLFHNFYCLIKFKKCTYKVVVLCGTWGMLLRCKNIHRTVVLKQRHLSGQRCSLARVAASSAHITHSRHMLVGSRHGFRSRRSQHSRSSLKLKSARERRAPYDETARGTAAAHYAPTADR